MFGLSSSRGERLFGRLCLIFLIYFNLAEIIIFARAPSAGQRLSYEQLLERAIQRKNIAEDWARRNGIKGRYFDGENTFEIMELRNGRPIYNMTHNHEAAISTAADLVRDNPIYDVNGSGFIVGIWDAGSVRSTHQEFSGRVTVKDGADSHYHSTHVGGTIGAAGVVTAAKGMAPAVLIDSYDWTSETAEMMAAAAKNPQQAGKVCISNHSYGHIAGWVWTNWSGNYGYHWNPAADWAGSDSVEAYFGQYDETAQTYDEIAYDSPYYLIFKSAGNDRSDNPSVGVTVYYSTNGGITWKSMSYDPNVAPLGDGVVKGGYDTITHRGVAKNIMTVGAVDDAVLDGVRDLTKATMTTFSSWGPTDDGRIKPDIVANGVKLYSTDDDSDTDYTILSGTSMSAPNASGSAVLLVDYYDKLHPGKAMRSSTLKGLIIHTADDLGPAGPDYKFGWGLMNTKAAADLIAQGNIREAVLDNNSPNDVYRLVYDGNAPIRVTLCWTDPPADALDTYDDPSPRLVNDLDMRIIGPDQNTVYYPYVLDPNNPNSPATTGDNVLDNVEQIFIGYPNELGTYTVTITCKTAIVNDNQYYSLISSIPFSPEPPLAFDSNVSAFAGTSCVIELEGSDDGRPDPPGQLEYIIVSLPEHGSISDPCAGVISSVPYVLVDNGNSVVYNPFDCYIGADAFQFKVDDGGVYPDGGSSAEATVSINVGTQPSVIYETDFEQGLPAGWSIIDGFSDGKTWMSENPMGRTNSNWTGVFMLVDSDWAGRVNMDEQLISHTIDCSHLKNIKLIFKHYFRYYWFGRDEIGDVDVRVGQGQWQNIARYQDRSYEGQVELALPEFVEGQPDVQIRWHYYNARFEWYWGIDDVQIIAEPIVETVRGDFEGDCNVDFVDFGLFASVWLSDVNSTAWEGLYDISEPNDGIINEADLGVFADSWLTN